MLVSKYTPSEFEADDNYTVNDDNDRELPLETCRIIANEDWKSFCFHFVKEYPDQNLSARMIICLEKHWQIWE
ncbi:12964_t:CDS:2 [Entrophospora sp. SA101]|nr:12964_t:CDS:2 [Entrophospora sp. SA101]